MSTTETQFDVEGMTCAACATRIERVLTKQEGVDQVVVNFASGNAKVFGEVHIPDLEAAVAKIGYGIQELGEDDEKPDIVARYEEEQAEQWRRFLGAAALSVPLVILAMVFAIAILTSS